jgi:beta-mannosidase
MTTFQTTCRLDLAGQWQLDGTDEQGVALSCAATVPGDVHSALFAAGLMPDPFWGRNERDVQWVAQHDWTFSREFDVPEDFLAHASVILRLEDCDTFATVFVNDVEVGETRDRFMRWDFDVRDVLRPGRNKIRLVFASAWRKGDELAAGRRPHPMSNSETAWFNNGAFIRKPACHRGWDWGLAQMTTGPCGAVSLIASDGGRIDSVRCRQDFNDDLSHCTLTILATLETGAEVESVLEIDKPPLWWPNGQGEQRFVEVGVYEDGSAELMPTNSQSSLSTNLHCPQIKNTKQNLSASPLLCHSALKTNHPVNPVNPVEEPLRFRVGLRKLELDTEGGAVCFKVNNRPIFMKGANWIPCDAFESRQTPARYRDLLESAVAANMNMIRLWGGGQYEKDCFYDLCDELGLLVWQDFMFACAVYNLTDSFEANIRAEFLDNIRRLRHHASLALWCGNNEMEDFVKQGQWVSSDRQRADYIKMYEYILPSILKEEDPQRFYWPASPSSGGSFDFPQDPDRGDVHYWQVWHGLKPFTDYRNHFFRYVSEFGFQSFPCMKTIESFTEPGDRNPFSYVMEKHQRNASANGRIVSYISQMYLYPKDLDTLVYASQLLQAQAMQYGVEHWRRNRGRCMGAIIWQLNDCWPVASWSSIDYYGRWKALHYAARRFFAPVLLSCHEEGILSQDTNVNAEPFVLRKSARLNLSNETLQPFRGRALWALRKPDGSVIESGGEEIEAAPLSAVWLPEQKFPEANPFETVYTYVLEDENGRILSNGSVLFCPPKHFRFADPELSARIEDDEIVVTASAYARSVEIRCSADTVLSDNFFDMTPGERRVKILRGDVKTVSCRSVYDIR